MPSISSVQPRAGRFALFQQLLADDATCMFGNPGTSEQNLLDAMRAEELHGFKYYLSLHEGSAVAMADAYARATRRPAVVQLHSYAGLANGLGMIYGARIGGTPLVVLVGEAGLRYEAMDGQMSADLISMARPFVKADHNGPCAWRVVDRHSLLRLVRRSFKTAQTPPAGPVLLVLPMDILDQDTSEAIVPSTLVAPPSAPDSQTVEKAARLLAQSSRPLIVMGDGIAAANAQLELARIAELLGASVWGANSSEVNIPDSHPLYAGDLGHMFGEDSAPVTSAADAVLVCGTRIFPEVFPALDGVFASDASVIQFDLNSYEIGKNFPIAVGAVANPKVALSLLAEALDGVMSPAQKRQAQDRLKQKGERKQAAQKSVLEKDAALGNVAPLKIAQFTSEMVKRWVPGSLIYDEALTNSPELRRYLPADIPGTYFQTRAGMLGTGLPGAIGLKLAQPSKTVFGFVGDGGGISTIQGLATAARYRIGTKFVVCNNGSYRILKYNLQRYWKWQGRPMAQPFPNEFDLQPPVLRFDKMAEAQGVEAVRVERASEIGPALDRAFANDHPFLIDLVLSSAL